MGAMDEYTGQQQRVGNVERERAEHFLQDAYAEGRIDEDEFSQRIDLAMNARTRGDLNAAFTDLVPAAAPFFGPHPVYRPPANRNSADVPGAKATAGITHLLPFISWIIGPAFVYVISPQGSYVKREAAKSFNWTLVSSLVFFLLTLLTVVMPFDLDFLVGAGWITWVALTIVGSVQAFSGANWANPLMRLSPWKPLSEK